VPVAIVAPGSVERYGISMSVDIQKIQPVAQPVSGTIRPPGSKSITNRALVVAALADGKSRLSGLLESDDTAVMLQSLHQLGIGIERQSGSDVVSVTGCGGKPTATAAELWLQNSGTSIRFLTALCTLGAGRYRLDGIKRMRERPIGDLVDALNQLGADVQSEFNNRCPPVIVNGNGLPGGSAGVAGNISSQYLSALLMAAPAAQSEVVLNIIGKLVSKPYVEMTLNVMRSFGADVETNDYAAFQIAPQKYQAIQYAIEPDASAASYFFASAAITGGTVTVDGLSRNALQGDVEFVTALEQMGCQVDWQDNAITVTGGKLHGIDIDMNAISDTAQTLAAVAVFAEGPTRIRNIAHVRHKETDRIAAVVQELKRIGIAAEEFDDGLMIHPGTPTPGTIETYDDHRMAMSFALIGLKAAGIGIADPGCTAKTYPKFFDDLQRLTRG